MREPKSLNECLRNVDGLARMQKMSQARFEAHQRDCYVRFPNLITRLILAVRDRFGL